MVMTLATMLGMEPLVAGEPEVVVAVDGLERPVRWVHVTEVSDLHDLLGGQEVVLTTGLPLVGPGADPRAFVDQLADADACGLVVELGPRLPELPTRLVDAAVRRGLPVVALHSPVRFVEVTESVHRAIVGEQYRGLAFAQRTHEVFTDLSLDSADAASILREASDLIREPLVLEDAGHRVVAMAARDHAPGQLLDGWERRSRSALVLDRPGTTGDERWLTCPVGLRGSAWGRLVAPLPVADAVESAVVLQRAAQALQLSRLVERDAAGLQVQARASLLQDLSDGRVADESDALARARALGMRPAGGYLPVVADFGATATTDQIVHQRRARAHLEAVSEAVRAAHLDAIAGGVANGQVGLVVTLGRGISEDGALTSLSIALTERQGSGSRTVLGVGVLSRALLEAARNLPTTMHLASAGRALPGATRPWYRSTDVRLRGLVAQLQDDERVVAFAESELGPLLALDAPVRDPLLELLRAYVALGGNKAAVAERVHLSRQALYGRLRRLEGILLTDLDDPVSVHSLGVALLVDDVRRLGRRPG
jgi:purine catabolism regulator